MRGDVVFQVYGLHEERADDVFFGAFPTRGEAETKIAELESREMHGKNWAARYHDQGFVIREAEVATDFAIPSRPKPRDRYLVTATAKPNPAGAWSSALIEVFRRGQPKEKICEYERNHSPYSTFEPFRQGTRELALISRDYTKTAVLDLETGQVIAEEQESYYDKDDSQPGAGFCPVGFYVPDWWDLHDGSIIPGSLYWDADREWPTGEFGFVWGCYWGDDSSWKVQHLDLRRLREGIISRDDRFGYVELATAGYQSPCFRESLPETEMESSRPPPFISIERHRGEARVTFAVEVRFDLESGEAEGWSRRELDGE